MDTPTSSQQDLIQDHDMEDDVEYVEPPLPRKAFPPSNRPAREMSPNIPIDRLSVAATHHSAQANTPSHVFGGTTDSSSRQYPLPTQTAPLMYNNDLDTRYRPGSPSDVRNQINSKRRDMHAEIQQLITETKATQREVIKEVSSPWIRFLQISFISRIQHGRLLRIVRLHITSEPPRTTCDGRYITIQ